MATIAQVKRDRQKQLNSLQQALRHYDAAQEAFERIIRRYRGKRKMLEATDFPALSNAFRAMNDKFGSVETELINLSRIIAAV